MKTNQNKFAFLEDQLLKSLRVEIKNQDYKMMCMCCL
jgi:hypothetical protein